MKLHSVLFAAAALGATALSVGLAAGPAYAEDVVVTGRADEVPTATVRYGDLNLALAEDRARLDRRVDWAADKLCGDTARELYIAEQIRVCRTAVFSSAEPQVKALVAAAQGQQVALGDVAGITLSAK